MRLRWLLITFLLATTAWAQTASDISAEPHYSFLFQNKSVQVFSLVLPPQQQSFVRYQHNFLLVSLQESNLVMWEEGHSDITSFHLAAGGASFFYSASPKAQGFRNQAGTTYSGATYRGVLVEFLDPNVTTYGYQTDGQWELGYGSITPPAAPQAGPFSTLPLGAATAMDFQLPAGALAAAPKNGEGELLIPATDVNLRSTDGLQILKAPGEAVWIPGGRKSALTNAGSQPACFVLIEFNSPAVATPQK